MYSQSCLIKNASIPLTRTFGAYLSVGKDNAGMAFPWKPIAVGSASHCSRGFFVSFPPQIHKEALHKGIHTISSKRIPHGFSRQITIRAGESPPSFPPWQVS